MKRWMMAAAAVVAVMAFPAVGDMGTGGPDPVPSRVMDLVESEQYESAIVELKSYLKRERKSADGWNLLGYSQRSSGDLDGALASYKRALKIDRRHLGANEYLGRLYVMRGDLDNARKQLATLEKYCGDCDEYQKLAEVIANSQ